MSAAEWLGCHTQPGSKLTNAFNSLAPHTMRTGGFYGKRHPSMIRPHSKDVICVPDQRIYNVKQTTVVEKASEHGLIRLSLP
jgi:hypothetical protein